MQNFRKLLVWKKAHGLALEVRRLARTFPRDRNWSLASQLVGAADSIAENIVEGCGASSRREFARFLAISIKSSSEAEYQLQLAADDGALSRREWGALTASVIEIRKMLSGLRQTVLAKDVSRKKGPEA